MNGKFKFKAGVSLLPFTQSLVGTSCPERSERVGFALPGAIATGCRLRL
ncbi:MAG: hypothetical protein WCX92_03770 [Thermovirgaceae bacterium]|nr:hypothetical protein [Synergistales bacterium]MDD4023576.1 hypothetical protein [Synergistales bacterium]